jgi:1,2-dihydroxy-3-keto-5-methylthiopentene dioxygenase
MAEIHIPDQDKTIKDTEEIRRFLKPFGIWYEKWVVEGRVGKDATNEEILEAYKPEIERLKEQGGFVTADVINVSPETPGLDEMLNRFNKEHTHSEDEVRFTVAGKGLFHINPENGPVFSVTVESGDLINVPNGMRHWFNLCEDRHIRCIRLFEDPGGWTPKYESENKHENYAALCMGPAYFAPTQQKSLNTAVDLN